MLLNLEQFKKNELKKIIYECVYMIIVLEIKSDIMVEKK